SIIVVMLYLNTILLGRRHWGGSSEAPERWFHYGARAVALVVAAVSLTVLSTRAEASLKPDVTYERIHSLSADTRRILGELDPKRPVLVEAYISDKVPRDYVETKRNLIALLQQFDAIGGDAVQLNLHEGVQNFSKEAQDAERVYGIKAEQIAAVEDGRVGREDVFLGVALKSGLNRKVVPFFYRGLPVEYELTRLIRTVAEKAKRKIGVLTTDAGLFGQFNFQSMSPPEDWYIVQELRTQYDVVQVSPDASIENDVEVLIVPMASSLTQPQMDNVVAFVKAGRPTLILDDPMPFVNPKLAPREPKPSAQQNPMFGGGPPPVPKGNLKDLTNLLNIEFDTSNVVWQDWNPHPQFRDLPPEYVFVGKNSDGPGFSEKSPITAGLQELVLIYPGAVKDRDGDGPDFIPLLTTGKQTGVTSYKDVLIDAGFLGKMLNPAPRRRITEKEYVLAAYIEGKLADADVMAKPTDDAAAKDDKKGPPSAKVIFVADIDMITNAFFDLRRQGVESLQFDNVTFLMNCVDVLAGDQSFVELRKKRPKRRTLDRIEQMTSDVAAQARLSEE
ncbi:MAG: GldG family protein, partial [Planctomycetia bacterium]